MILVAFFTGFAFGAFGIIGGVGYVWARAGRSKLPSPRAALAPYAQLNVDGKLERLARADAVLGFAIGDEPVFGGRMWRKER